VKLRRTADAVKLRRAVRTLHLNHHLPMAEPLGKMEPTTMMHAVGRSLRRRFMSSLRLAIGSDVARHPQIPLGLTEPTVILQVLRTTLRAVARTTRPIRRLQRKLHARHDTRQLALVWCSA
jgi:hypothetical protein